MLSKAYGRYHKFSNGKEIMNRPKDNRFDGTLRDFRYLVKPYPIQGIETKQEKKATILHKGLSLFASIYFMRNVSHGIAREYSHKTF